MIAIEKGVPIPAGNESKYPWRKMEIGDSFYVAGVNPTAIYTARARAQRETGFKFCVKGIDGGTRVWRVL